MFFEDKNFSWIISIFPLVIFFGNGRADGQSNIFSDVARKIFTINNSYIFFHDLQINKH